MRPHVKASSQLHPPETKALEAKGLLSPEGLASWLGVPLPTVYAWRTKSYGPRGFKVGRHVRYRATEVERWLDTQADAG